MRIVKKPPGIWVGQVSHFSMAALLLALVWVAWEFMERPAPVVFWIAVSFPVAHQLFVWLAWRLELRSNATSKSIGFHSYVAIFFLLFGGRFVSLVLLALMDFGSLNLHVVPQVLLTSALTLLGAYAGYSVAKYFGMVRAAGADHFEPKYREMPLVKKGIFRFTSNGMYVYAFLVFWAIAIGCNSIAALTVAAFSHAYIWVHYYATEKPDMVFLYGQGH